MHHNSFYDYLPKHKIELFEGRVLVGSSLRVARMVLDRILRGYGPEYILPLVETHELREACIEAFGREQPDEPVYTKVAPTMPVARTASELMMNLYALRHYGIFGRDIVVKLGQNAFTPDVFLYRDPADPRMQSYYFDGAPDLIIEVMHPATRAFDAQERLSCYRAAEVPEIWLIDYESEAITVYRAADAYEACRVAPGAPLAASILPGLTLHTDRLWQVKANPWNNYRDLVMLSETAARPESSQKRQKISEDTGSDLPFAPDIGLLPTPISFEQFIAWAPEAKFEWMDGQPHIGGGTDTNLHLTGLLLMTFGLTEAVRSLSADAWTGVL